ncbi:unnamed protein product [Protopolystoma xenopodis]|uniref:Uncharacterized protein n=1 Tax=Protopolystoma xenopodis TaxID=117903 RepID=A0A3S5BGF6_9PLAT|nr:unnamed protein product [Protopolystoma xenopodis]
MKSFLKQSYVENKSFLALKVGTTGYPSLRVMDTSSSSSGRIGPIGLAQTGRWQRGISRNPPQCCPASGRGWGWLKYHSNPSESVM